MPKAWRRTGKDPVRSLPALLLADFTVATRILLLNFDRNVTIVGVMSPTSLTVFSGANKYLWSVTTVSTGFQLRFTQAVGTPDATLAALVWSTVGVNIRDSYGQLWPAGSYPITIH